jgi:hypothetical protein
MAPRCAGSEGRWRDAWKESSSFQFRSNIINESSPFVTAYLKDLKSRVKKLIDQGFSLEDI